MREQVRQYYGQVLKSSADLRTSACCTDTAMAPDLKAILAEIHPEVASRYHGASRLAGGFEFVAGDGGHHGPFEGGGGAPSFDAGAASPGRSCC